MKEFIKKQKTKIHFLLGTYDLIKSQSLQQDLEYERLKQEIQIKFPDCISLFGSKKYSQTDEDGIIEEIFNRIPNNKSFLEIGIQTGVECNTHYLLLRGWKGVWIEGSKDFCQIMKKELNGLSFPGKLNIVNSFIDRENILNIFNDANEFLNVKELDFFSLDIDGNDFYIMEELLNNSFSPKVVCVEYNAKFPPPVKMKIKYNKFHIWDSSDYMGCAIQDYIELFAQHGYSLLCCNIPGFNAFFIKNEYASKFTIYPPEQLYRPYKHYLSPLDIGSRPSLKFLRDTLNE